MTKYIFSSILMTALLTACMPNPTAIAAPPTSTSSVRTWNGLPLMPGAVANDKFSPKYISPAYHVTYEYMISNTTPNIVMQFYRDEMLTTSWKLLAVTDMGGRDIGPAYELMYTKEKNILLIQIYVKENTTYVDFVFFEQLGLSRFSC